MTDEVKMIFALVLFLATYVLLLLLPKYRAYIALATAVVFVAARVMTAGHIVTLDWIPNWNVLMMIAGTMGIVSLFIESKMPALLADLIIDKMPNVKWATLALSLFAGLISAFVDNVATVLMVAPVAVTIAKKLKISPVNMVIAIAISSNLQGAATLVGDTTSILLGAEAKMNFAHFFFFRINESSALRPSLFWICQAGALASALILLFLFRKDKQPIHMEEKTQVTDYVPSVLLLGTIVLLIIASFLPIPEKLRDAIPINGIICMTLFLIGLVRNLAKRRDIVKTLKEVDGFTLLLLFSLFVIIGGIEEAGIIDKISMIIQHISAGNLFVIFTILCWISVAFSAVIDNIPYVMTMLPVVTMLANSMSPTGQDTEGIRFVMYFGLVVGATLGGNLTPIGASANIAGIGILRKEGHEVSVRQFMRISVPFTLAAVITGYILVWLLFKPAGFSWFG
ncbi:MAG: Arsenical pump membrane protein [Firmicutes bacterium ADurb.Bin262]|nr:MAG: Arsenical pump membrane protein [Firmicutes bacterium ADurb.Bin262]